MGRHSRNAVVVVLGVLAAGAAACRSGGDSGAGAPPVGVLQMPLVATAEGNTYRLRHATFTVTGPTAATLDSEAQPDAASLTATLTTGAYSIALAPGWSLERLDGGGAVVVSAALTSPNPTTFTIAAAATTMVAYQFTTDGRVVTFNMGTLEVTIGVTVNHDGGAADGDGATGDGGAADAAGGSAAPTTLRLGAIAAGNGGFSIDGDVLSSELFVPTSVGDVNGDGLDDVVIGAPFTSVAGTSAGATYVVFGKVGGAHVQLADVAAGVGGFVIFGSGTSDFSGFQVAGTGDVNGDGLDDILLAESAPALNTNTPAALVVFGKANGNPVSVIDVRNGLGGFSVEGEPSANGTSFLAVSRAGDVNGDGLADLLVSSEMFDANFSATERAYVVFGKADNGRVNLSEVVAGAGGFAIDREAPAEAFGNTLGSAGDVNGDGLDDVIIGATQHPSGVATGRAYVVFGKRNNNRVSATSLATGGGGLILDGETFGQQFGTSVDGAGDVNGDGIPDLVVTGQAFREGISGGFPRTYVIFGSRTGSGVVKASDIAAGVGGFSVDELPPFSLSAAHRAGDVNGDGLDDVVIGTQANFSLNHPSFTFGRAYVLYGKKDTAAVQTSDLEEGRGGFALRSDDAGPNAFWSSFGFGTGDVDGDGFPDVLLAAQLSPLGYTGYVIHGGDFGGRATAVGGPGDDTLVASHGPGADLLVGGAGNDTLISDGGEDVLLGGAGDDRLVVTGGLGFRADGGGGSDTLAIGTAGMSLDLTQVPLGRIRSVETVDISGFGANTLTLDLAHARSMPHGTRTLTVTGDPEDTLVLVAGGAAVQVGPGAGGGVGYTVGVVTVRVVGGPAVRIQ
jgi:hypothetical protein